MIRYLYTIFLGLILALFIGLGIATFYEGPKQPEYPTEMMTKATQDTPEARAIDAKFQTELKTWEKANQRYSRNVSIIAVVSAILLLVLGFIVENKNRVIGGGVVLGGLFALIYGIIRGFVSTDTKYTFMIVVVGVVVALYLGYRNFSHRMTVDRKRKS